MSFPSKVIGIITKPDIPGKFDFEWSINDCSEETLQTKGYMESPTFYFSDCCWCVRLYPKGVSILGSGDFISIYLIKRNSQSEKNITFALSMVLKDKMFARFQDNHTFKKYANDWGCEAYALRKGILDYFHWFWKTKLYGKLNIQIRFMSTVPSKADIKQDIEISPQNFKDLVLPTEPGRPPLRFRCSDGSLKECPNHHTLAYQQFLVQNLYRRPSAQNKDGILNFYSMADKYIMEYLVETCCEFMRKSLSPHNVCEVIGLALNFTNLSLLEMAEMYFVDNAKEVLVTAEWQSFTKENPFHANRLLSKTAKDYQSKKNKSKL